MSDTTQPLPASSKSRMRSPAYPLFGLGEAIKKIRAMWDSQRKNDAHLDSVLNSIGYGGRHGASLRAIGALNHYGLTEESGSGDNRRLRLSESAQDIIHLPEEDPKRGDALKKAALSPAIHAILWERYQHQIPQDSVLKAFLVREKGYNEAASLDVIKNYRDSFAVAKLGQVTDSKPIEVNSSHDQLPRQSPQPKVPIEALQTFAQVTAFIPPIVPMIEELPILVGPGKIARIPFPMTEGDFELLLGTLRLWKKKLVPEPTPPPPIATASKSVSEWVEYYPVSLRGTWKNHERDEPVVIIGIMSGPDHSRKYLMEDGTGIPDSEVSFS